MKGVDRWIPSVVLQRGQGLRRQLAHRGERVLIQSGDLEAQTANRCSEAFFARCALGIDQGVISFK